MSGLLYKENLLLFDRDTESLWSQLRGQAVAGHLAGTHLRLLPVSMSTWRNWRADHPLTLVLAFQTGYKRDYSRDPYRDWPLDRRMTLVVAYHGETKIYPYSELKKAGASVEDEIGGLVFTIFFDEKGQSATIRASGEEPPPHLVAFLGDARVFFPDAAIFKAH